MKLNLPTNIYVCDYHEFSAIVAALAKFGIRGIKYKEIPGAGVNYEAVFYRGKYTGSKAEKLFKQLVREYEQDSKLA